MYFGILGRRKSLATSVDAKEIATAIASNRFDCGALRSGMSLGNRDPRVYVYDAVLATPAAVYRSAWGPRPKECECFVSAFGHLAQSAPRGVLIGTLGLKKCQKAPLGALFAALRARCQKRTERTHRTFQPRPLGTPVNGGRGCNVVLSSQI